MGKGGRCGAVLGRGFGKRGIYMLYVLVCVCVRDASADACTVGSVQYASIDVGRYMYSTCSTVHGNAVLSLSQLSSPRIRT